MATTEAEICNVALSRVGNRQYIDSLIEDTAEAQVCAMLYPGARDTMLASYPWPWAQRRLTLAALVGVTRAGWDYAFALPADLVTARAISTETRNPLADSRVPYSIESDSTVGRILLVDEEAPELVYTSKITSVALWPALFADAVQWRLAMELALAWPDKASLAALMGQQAERAMARAIASEMRQSQDDVALDAEAIRARR